MKHTSVRARRWFATLIVSLLLCGAGTLDLAAAPAIPAEDARTVEPAAPAVAEAAAAPLAINAVTDPYLWGWWKFDSVTNDGVNTPTTPDSSGHNRSGYLGDDGGGDQPSLTTADHAPSFMANAASMSFDGGSDWISMHAGPNIASNASFSLAAWIKWDGGKSNIFFQGQPDPHQGLQLGIDLDAPVLYPNQATLICSFWDHDLRYDLPDPHSWHHVACVCDHDDGHARRLYVDGVEVAADTPSDWYTGGGDLWVGRKRPSTAEWDYDGKIDEARIYTRALSAAEVEGLAARSDAANVCFSSPLAANGSSDGTVYASVDATAVQAGVDTLGAAGGTVRLAGTCTGVGPALVNSQLMWQTALIPTLNAGATLTLQGGWNTAFTDHSPGLHPTTLNADGSGRMVNAPGTTGSLALQDLTLTNGDSTAAGGGACLPGVGGCVAGGPGGGVRTAMSTNLSNVTVSNSRSRYMGGGIYATGSLVLTDSTISGNETGRLNSLTGSWDARGGGIYAAGSLSLTGCTVTDNQALVGAASQGMASLGGGIYVSSNYTLSSCQVTSNSAYQGGGLYGSGGPSSISGSTFSGNSASSGEVAGTDDDGGGLYVSGGALTIADSTIENNAADGEAGGIYLAGGTLALNSSNLRTNAADADGGGLRISAGTVTVSGGAISNNSAPGSNGGGAYVSGTGALTLQSVTVSNNSARQGAGICNSGGTTRVTGGVISGNQSSGSNASGGGLALSGGTLTVNNATISGNSSLNGGGLAAYLGTASLTGVAFSSNTASDPDQQSLGYGGAVYVEGGSVSLTSPTISANGANRGAGLSAAGGTTTLTGGQISGNSATNAGGGAYLSGTGILNLTNTTITGNSAYHGAGLSAAGGTTTLTGSQISGNGNSATSFGGGADVSGGVVNLASSTVQNNSAKDSGGGAYVSGGTLNLTSSSVATNQAAKGGGFTAIGGTVTASGSTIAHNGNSATTTDGGGAYVWGGNVSLASTTISDNAAGVGGGLAAAGGTTTVITSTITDNQATTGGGAHVSGTGTLNVTATTVKNNGAADGAGLYLAAGTLSVRNSTLSANTGTTSGGGLRVQGGAATLGFATLTDNQAPEGAGLYAGAGTTSPTSSIIARNRTAADVYGGDVKSVAGLTSGGGNVIGVGDVSSFTASMDQPGVTDPGLGPLGSNGVHPLLSSSVAVDAAPCAVGGVTYTKDQLGQPRPGPGTNFCDSGAYEIQISVANCMAKSAKGLYTGSSSRTLQQAVDEADPGDTVKVAGTCRGAFSQDPGDPSLRRLLVLSKALTLEGGYSTQDDETWQEPNPAENPTTLDASGAGGVIDVGSSDINHPINVTLRYLTITGGKRWGYAGVLVHNSANARVEYCRIVNNQAIGPNNGNAGGLAATTRGTATLVGNLIQGNSAVGSGGGLFVGGALTTENSLTLINNTLTGNSAGNGGAVANDKGQLTLMFNTIVGNTSNNGASLYVSDWPAVSRFTANILAEPSGTHGHCFYGPYAPAPTSGGFNRVGGGSCVLGAAPAGQDDLQNATVELGELAYNGGPTPNFLPAVSATNSVLDVAPVSACEALLGTDPQDQRKRLRPSLGWETHPTWCDAGSVERGKEILAVCGPPLLGVFDEGPRGRCRYKSVETALKTAGDGDVIVVSGVIAESVTLNKNVTLRGPLPDWSTPGTHMGFLQGATSKPGSSCTPGSSVVTVASGTEATIEDLNVRYGCATNGGGISNAGTLHLLRSTVYDNLAGTNGGGIYNSGNLDVADSTLSGNAGGTGGAIFNASGATLTVRRSTLTGNTASSAQSIANDGTAQVGGSILASTGAVSQCSTGISTDAANLVSGPDCGLSGVISGNPVFVGGLRDNGGATLSYAIAATSPAVNMGYSGAAQCGSQVDQRGRARPAGAACDLGAYEYGPRTLIVDAAAVANPDALLFDSLQPALDSSMTGDTIDIRAGTYTGNFTAYRDVNIRHADVDAKRLSPELSYDLRAILQPSPRTVQEQHQLGTSAGTVLTVEGYAPTGLSFEPTKDVTVTLQGLTIRHGAGVLGGGVHNLGHLTVQGSTIEGNAAVSLEGQAGLGGGIYNAGELRLVRSTVSGNRAEQYGGALYNDSPGIGVNVTAVISASTLAQNLASPLPDQYIVSVKNAGLAPNSLPIWSGDEVRFETQDSQAHTMRVQSTEVGVSCRQSDGGSEIEVPRSGLGLSTALICATDATVAAPETRTVVVADNYGPTLTLVVSASLTIPDGATLYQAGDSQTTLGNSIVYSGSGVENCGRQAGASHAQVQSQGSNFLEYESGYTSNSSCTPAGGDLVASDPKLGPLQDNNAIDFASGTVSGYTESRALLPTSPAIDYLKPEACEAQVKSLDLDTVSHATPGATSLRTGDVLKVTSTYSRTIVLNDGQYDERLITVPQGKQEVRLQFAQAGTPHYRLYDTDSREVGYGSIAVTTHADWPEDQRGVTLPQHGTAQTYGCDIGAYEFAAWVVGQPLPRPPSAIGKNPPQWAVNGASVSDYAAWSAAPMQDYAIRPTRPAQGGRPVEVADVSWSLADSLSGGGDLTQSGIVVWPDSPQLHVAGAKVNLSHSGITDGFNVSPDAARAFEGYEPQDELAGTILTGTDFDRSELSTEGESYSVLHFSKSSQTSATLKVVVVKTVNWNTAGIQDRRDRMATDGYGPTDAAQTDCLIGSELVYPDFTDVAGTMPGHADPEGRPGWILFGDAYDGVRTTGEQITVQNTVDNLIGPAHVQENRQGPIIPILNQAPAQDATDSRTEDDLRVAWYRPDGRNVAWPVKAVAYHCRWPVDEKTPEIVVASELGSEIASQALLSTSQYVDPTVYHQTDQAQPGYSPNYEHALLSSSNLGNTEPALYALRTDLFNRNTSDQHVRSYALLKYRDARQNGRIQMAVYRVVLAQDPKPIPYASVAGGIGISTAPPEGGPTAGKLSLRVGTGLVGQGTRATVPVEALNGVGLHSAVITVTYDASKLDVVGCAPNTNRFAERPTSIRVQADDNVLTGYVVHMRVTSATGSDLRYRWDFDDGTVQYDDRVVSHVYGAAGSYTVRATVSSNYFADEVIATAQVNILDTYGSGQYPILIGTETAASGCRLSGSDKVVLDLVTRSKHGLAADSRLASLTFAAKSGFTSGTANISVSEATPKTPDYSKLEYGLDAGLPVYAPTPMRGLLDIQPCANTQADTDDIPFWKDWKGMLWARAAGDMSVKYFYPLQRGFYLDAQYAADHGLPATEAGRVGKCVPWLDNLPESAYPDGTTPVEYVDQAGGDQERMVFPVSYRVSWPQLPALLNVGETVFQRAKGGVSAVGTQAAVTRIYDDLAASTWDNDVQNVVMDPNGVVKSVAQLIDPLAQVQVELPVWVEGNASLPTDITTQRLLYGAGLALTGNANNPDLALPFALRSRITFQDTAVDLNGDGEAAGTLTFKGYYDGTSPEYIKGDPLLLLNVMSDSDLQRLKDLCPSDTDDCKAYTAAVEELYWKTQNPRDLDLCRDSSGKLSADDTAPAQNQGTQAADPPGLSQSCPAGTYRDGVPDHALLIAVQDTPSLDLYGENGDPGSDGAVDAPDGIPEPFQGLGKGKALTAGNAAGTGYITVAYNNDSSLGALPVSLQVIKVECAKNSAGEESPYRGNLLVIKSDNLFDEKLTLRHTGDFGGRPDNFEFDWWIAAVDDTGVSPTAVPPSYPWQPWTQPEKGATTLGPQITIEGANPTTLRDNWVIVRYKNKTCPVCGNEYNYSMFAGDPSAKPSQVLAQLAEGWIKRVTNALNPFDTRVDDFVSAPTNSTVDMIRQAGKRYEGPVAMNNDPDNLNSMGLIEAYQTVLARGRALSIDAGVNDQGANAALLNVTSRIAGLYMLLANDAYMDALDPTVGLSTNSELGVRAPALFAFENQFPAGQFGLIDEELGLLRGRDETLGGVAAAPTYNRLTWNFTNGDGEVAYVMNYNIKDVNQDGFLNEADAAIMYPQGHGDAWGHFLTAVTKYYELLRHQNYTWVPRAEPLNVAGAPVVVDYYDERRFATAAAEKARMGAEIVNLTYRKDYADPNSQEYVDTHIDSSDNARRAWGVADWAERAGQGAYFDWVVANAIIPPEDDRYTDLRKIDRSTVEDIAEIANQYAAIQEQLDRADNLANPLGLTGDAVLFDLDPALTKTTPTAEGQTHFEQVYDRSLSSLSNALKLYDYANEVKIEQRDQQNQQRDFSFSIMDEDRARVNELIEIFGYPYDADIGVNGTYPTGYDGPDIYDYDLIDRTEITDAEMRCTDAELKIDPNTGETSCPSETSSFTLEFAPMQCLGSYVTTLTGYTYGQPFKVEDVCNSADVFAPTKKVDYTVGVGLDAGYGRYKPNSWPGTAARKSWGEVQRKMWGVYDAKTAYENSALAYRNQVEAIEQQYKAMKDRAEYLEFKNALDTATKSSVLAIDEVIKGIEAGKAIYDIVESSLWDKGWATAMGQPFVVGIDNDLGCVGRLTVMNVGFAFKDALETAEAAIGLTGNIAEMAKEGIEVGAEIGMFDKDADQELKQMGYEMNGLLRDERTLRLDLYLAADNYYGSWDDYKAEVQLGFRKLQDLVRMRKRWAGQIEEMRYGDMAYRVYQNDALLKYREQFDMAQGYVYLTAAAYDYETNLRGSDPANGVQFLRSIVGARSLGELRWTTGPWDVEPIVGSGGLAEPLGKMRDDFVVLKGQMGFNNPQAETNRFSLRHELFRLRDSSDASWRQTLARYYTPNIFANPIVAKLAKRPYGDLGPEPGLVIPFGSTITRRLNFFGNPLGPGDSSYSSTQFATKIANVGVWFKGYDTNRLSQTPRVYLLPGGQDVIRPRNTDGVLRYWNVTEQLLPLPYPISQADMQNPNWIASIDGLQGQYLKIKPYADMRAYPYTDDLQPSELNTDTRLIGRSVWNTDWVLVIPGATLLADPDMGIDRFMQDVDDIYVYFQTYAYAGSSSAPDTAPSETVDAAAQAVMAAAAVSQQSLTANPMPQPDAILYGVALHDGTPLTSGTLTAILPRLGTITTEIGPIAGTDYNYRLPIPLAYYDGNATDYAADSARVGETIQIRINGVPAVLKDHSGAAYQAYPIGAPGTGYAVTVDVSGAGSYPPGDVNVSGRRDSADALLVLKYDVGLMQGVMTWPPGPGTIYLPLCDINGDGACNSTDALRILMCDVGLAACPAGVGTSSAAAAAALPPDALPAYLSTEQQVDAAAGQIVVRVLAESPHSPLAAASLDLHFDPAQVSVAGCAENPAGRLDLAVCNAAFAPDTVRYTGITTGGIVESAALVELRLTPLDPAALEQLAQEGSTINIGATLFDLDGKALQPIIETKPPTGGPSKLFLPLIMALPGAGPDEPAPVTELTPEPTIEVTPEPTMGVTPEPTAEVTPELTGEATAVPTAEATAAPTAQVTPEPTAEATAVPTAEVTPEPTAELTALPPAEPAPGATPEAIPEPKALVTPSPTPAPQAGAQTTPEPTPEIAPKQ